MLRKLQDMNNELVKQHKIALDIVMSKLNESKNENRKLFDHITFLNNKLKQKDTELKSANEHAKNLNNMILNMFQEQQAIKSNNSNRVSTKSELNSPKPPKFRPISMSTAADSSVCNEEHYENESDDDDSLNKDISKRNIKVSTLKRGTSKRMKREKSVHIKSEQIEQLYETKDSNSLKAKLTKLMKFTTISNVPAKTKISKRADRSKRLSHERPLKSAKEISNYETPVLKCIKEESEP